MLYQHKKTGEKREFVQGMQIAPEWSPLRTMQTEHGVLSISEVDPKSISTIKSRKAAATRAKNKSSKKKNESQAEAVEKTNEKVIK